MKDLWLVDKKLENLYFMNKTSQSKLEKKTSPPKTENGTPV